MRELGASAPVDVGLAHVAADPLGEEARRVRLERRPERPSLLVEPGLEPARGRHGELAHQAPGIGDRVAYDPFRGRALRAAPDQVGEAERVPRRDLAHEPKDPVSSGLFRDERAGLPDDDERATPEERSGRQMLLDLVEGPPAPTGRRAPALGRLGRARHRHPRARSSSARRQQPGRPRIRAGPGRSRRRPRPRGKRGEATPRSIAGPSPGLLRFPVLAPHPPSAGARHRSARCRPRRRRSPPSVGRARARRPSHAVLPGCARYQRSNRWSSDTTRWVPRLSA